MPFLEQKGGLEQCCRNQKLTNLLRVSCFFLPKISKIMSCTNSDLVYVESFQIDKQTLSTILANKTNHSTEKKDNQRERTETKPAETTKTLEPNPWSSVH